MSLPAEIAGALASPLVVDGEGIWRPEASASRAVSYPGEAGAACFAVEDDSWWFFHRNEVILRAVVRFPPSGPVWDIGGGNGFVARALGAAGWPAVLVEAGEEACRQARGRGVKPVIRAAFEDLRFRKGGMAAAGLFDVLEHIEDRAGFLRRLHDALDGPGKGRLYLTVPAHAWLWSGEDAWAGHRLRFGRRALAAELEAAGFKVIFEAFFFSWLSPLICLGRTLPCRAGRLIGRKFGGQTRRVGAVHGRLRKGAVRFFAHELARLEKGDRIGHGASLLAVGET
jgi:hypothetical protein